MSPDVVLEDGLDATLLAVTAPLAEAEIPYMLVGALAAMAYGRPRTIDDFDLAIDIRATTVDQLETVLARSGLDVVLRKLVNLRVRRNPNDLIRPPERPTEPMARPQPRLPSIHGRLLSDEVDARSPARGSPGGPRGRRP